MAALTDAFAVRLAPAERAGMEARRRADVQRVGQVLAQLAESDDVIATAATGAVRLDDLFGASGAAAIGWERVWTVGRSPSGDDLAAPTCSAVEARRLGALLQETVGLPTVP